MKNLREAIDRPSIQDMAPRAGVVTAVVLAAVVVGVGFVVYKRRQRRTLLKRNRTADSKKQHTSSSAMGSCTRPGTRGPGSPTFTLIGIPSSAHLAYTG